MMKMLQWAIMLKSNENTESLKTETDNFSKEIEDIKKDQMEILELKNT